MVTSEGGCRESARGRGVCTQPPEEAHTRNLTPIYLPHESTPPTEVMKFSFGAPDHRPEEPASQISQISQISLIQAQPAEPWANLDTRSLGSKVLQPTLPIA